MEPHGIAQEHPAAPLLDGFADPGCPVEISDEWTLDDLEEAVNYGAHPSARDATAAAACCKEALEKVEQGFVHLLPWRALKEEIR